MKLDSKFFDRIRIRPTDSAPRERFPKCGWEGCDQPGTHRAPMGRHREGQYHHFCLDHVRLYNKSYNYFSGMTDEAIEAYQKDALTGHRPTWDIGVNSWSDGPGHGGTARRHAPNWTQGPQQDPFGLFRGTTQGRARAEAEGVRPLTALEQRSFEVLDLERSASKEQIKARYKLLVKRHHPDANGGDRSTEEQLRQVIQAYGVLKNSGFC